MQVSAVLVHVCIYTRSRTVYIMCILRALCIVKLDCDVKVSCNLEKKKTIKKAI